MIVTEMGQRSMSVEHLKFVNMVRVGFNAPQWWDLRAGLRPPGQRVDERHVGIPGHGWQHEATEAVHAHLFNTTVWPRLSPPEQALIRSQGGPMSGVPLHVLPCEPGVQDRLVFVQGVAALASLASFLPQLPGWPST